MFPALTLTGVIKMMCAAVMAILMAVMAPRVLVHTTQPELLSYQTTIPERITSNEARLQSLEQRMSILESSKISERLATIETRQEAVLAMLVPIALFLFTHTLEVIQRMRGRQHSRKDD